MNFFLAKKKKNVTDLGSIRTKSLDNRLKYGE